MTSPTSMYPPCLNLNYLLSNQFSVLGGGWWVLSTNKDSKITSDEVWLSISNLFLVLLVPVPEERGGASDPFPPSVEISVIISAVRPCSSSDPIHRNISRLLGSLDLQLILVVLLILVEPEDFLTS